MIELRERKIYIKDLLLKILSKWISIFVAALVVGVIVMAAKYISDKNAYEHSIEAEEISKSAFSEAQLKNIEDYICIKDRLLYYSGYYKDSYLMKVNPANVTKLKVGVVVDSEYEFDLSDSNENDNLFELLGAYTTYFSSANFAQKMITELEKKYVKELINVTYNYEISMMTIAITIPESIDGATVLDRLNKDLVAIETEWQNIGEHKLRIISSSQDVEYDSELEFKIYNTRKSISDSQLQLTTLRSALSDAELEYLNKYYGEGANETIIAPDISLKYGVLGAVLGAVIMVFFHAFASILSNKLQNTEDIKTMYGVNVIGNIKNSANKAKADTEKLEYIASKLKILMAEKNVQRVHITGSNMSKLNEDVINMLVDKVGKNIEKVTVGKNICNDVSSLEMAKQADNVILIEVINASHYDVIAEQMQLAQESNMELLGVITVTL